MKFEKALLQDKILHADMLETLRRDNADICCESKTTLLLRVRTSGLFLFSSYDVKEGTEVLKDFTNGKYGPYFGIVLRGEGIPEAAKKLGYEYNECYQIVYDKKPPEPKGILEIRHPDAGDYLSFAHSYHLGNRYSKKAAFFSEEFFGAYKDGNFVGYVGLHDDGSMGYLCVLAKYRGRGYARELASFIISRQIKLKRIAYAQVISDNVPSLEMQKKMGFSFTDKMIYWSWRKKR